MSNNLTKRQIAVSLANCYKIPLRDAEVGVQVVLDAIADGLLQGKCVELRNFGVFEVLVRKPRVGRNPNNPEEPVEIPKRAVVKFKPGKHLKNGLKKLDIEKL